MLIFIDIYIFGLKLFTGLLVVHGMMQFMTILLLSALFFFLYVFGMTPRLVHINIYMMTMLSALFNNR